jgi:DNA polymerase eta
MLASKNVQPAVTSREGGYRWLGILAGELYVRLRDARDETEGLWPKTMVLSTRQGTSAYRYAILMEMRLIAPWITVGEAVRSRQIAFPFTRQLSADYITKYANKLWDEVSEPMMRQANSKSSAMRINNVSCSNGNRI